MNIFQSLLQKPSSIYQFASLFRNLGWLGFWCQIVLGAIPLLLLGFQWLFSSQNRSLGVIDAGNVFTFIDVFTLLFTIYWCFRYTQIGNELSHSQQYPPKLAISAQVWTGIIANLVVILVSVVIGLITLGGLLYVILSLPPGAATIFQPTPGTAMINSNPLIVPMDILGLLALMHVILAGLVGVVISLLLLHRLGSWVNYNE